MKYIGHYLISNLPQMSEGKLFVYVNDLEVIIHFNRDLPYQVNQISVMRCNVIGKESYDVFECLFLFDNDIKAKEFGTEFARRVIQERENGSFTYEELLGSLQL